MRAVVSAVQVATSPASEAEESADRVAKLLKKHDFLLQEIEDLEDSLLAERATSRRVRTEYENNKEQMADLEATVAKQEKRIRMLERELYAANSQK